MKKVYLILLLCFIVAGSYAMSFEKYLNIVFEKSDVQRDVKLYKKSNYWEKMNNLGMIIPRMDVTLEAPSYSFTDETEYTDAYGKPYSREKYSYGGNISLSQYLPTNTEIYSNMYYNHYKNYREAGVEENNLTGQTIEVTVNQKIWGINKGYHYYKKWRNISKINNIENKRFNLDILQKAYEKYINYLITKKSYQLNKKMYERYKNIYEGARNKYRMGLYDVITYNRIKKEYRFYEIDYKDSKRKMKSEKKKLEMFLNTEINDLDFSIKNINFGIFNDTAPRAKLKEMNLEFDNIYRDYKFSKADKQIRLYASISGEYNHFGQEGLSEIERDNYSISLSLSVPFTNLSKVSRLNNTEVEYLIEKYKKKDEIESIRIDFQNLKSDLKNYYDKISLYKDILPDLKENYNVSLKRFNMGMITLEELRSIENDYINAELDYLRALKNYNLTAIELGKYIGNVEKIMEGLL